ncbi:MAG: radical SAM protein [Pseudomonadota bacterium]
MKILFITPPNMRFRGVMTNSFALGPAYLAAVLKENHDIRYYEAEAMSIEEIDKNKKIYSIYSPQLTSHSLYVKALQNDSHSIWKEIESVISSFSPDVVGLSTLTSSYPAALHIAKMVKKNTFAKVIMGGVHPTILAQEVANNEYVDFVVRGEGEITLPQLISHLEKGTDPIDVPGLTFKKDGKIISTPDGAFVEDLNTIPFPDTSSLLFPERFSNNSFTNILAGRGCTASCKFCCNHVLWRKKYRMRSVENIFEELVGIYNKYGKTILFMDDNLMASPTLLFKLCEKIQVHIPDISWRCQSRIDTLTSEKLAISKESGCWDIKIGVESGSDRILNYLNKRLSVKQILECSEMILKSGIQFSANFMFGFMEETWEDMQLTLQLIRNIPANSIAVSKFIPLPGTELYDDAVKEGIFSEGSIKYEHLDLFSTYYHYPKHVSREKFYEFYLEIHQLVDEKNKKTRTGPPKPNKD